MHDAPLNANRSTRRTRTYGLFVALILVVAAWLRFAALDHYPLPLHQDELSDMYDGYSLATTGACRAGESWPLLIRGMGPGDYHPGMYAYISAITQSIAGIDVWWGRLPAAIAGWLTVLLAFLIARRLLGPAGAALALMFIAFSPIHIQYSRQAHQGVCLVPLFVTLILYLILKCLDRSDAPPQGKTRVPWVSIALCGFVIGFSTNAYAGMRMTALLFAGCFAIACLWQFGWRRSTWRSGAAAALLVAFTAAAGAAPQIYALVAHPDQFFARSGTTVYAIDHGIRWWAKQLLNNLWLNLEPNYLFLSFGEYSVMSVSRLSVVSLPFLYLGIVACVWIAIRRDPRFTWIPLAIAFSLLPALITKGNPTPMRSSGVWALYPIASALGAISLGSILRAGAISFARDNGDLGLARVFASSVMRNVATTALGLAIAAAGALNVWRYVRAPDLHGKAAQHHFVEIGQWARLHAGDYDRIYIDADGLFGYLFVAAFSGMTPEEFRQAPREGTVIGLGWDEFDRFGRFYFRSLDDAARAWRTSPRRERWIVLNANGQSVEFAPQTQAFAESKASSR